MLHIIPANYGGQTQQLRKSVVCTISYISCITIDLQKHTGLLVYYMRVIFLSIFFNRTISTKITLTYLLDKLQNQNFQTKDIHKRIGCIKIPIVEKDCSFLISTSKIKKMDTMCVIHYIKHGDTVS